MPLRKRMAWPSPPMPDASGSTTPSANAVAMAASTTLPPRASMSAPACDASGWPEATTPRAGPAAGLIGGCSAIISSITARQRRDPSRRHPRAVLRAQRIPRRSRWAARVVHRLQRLPDLIERRRPARGILLASATCAAPRPPRAAQARARARTDSRRPAPWAHRFVAIRVAVVARVGRDERRDRQRLPVR